MSTNLTQEEIALILGSVGGGAEGAFEQPANDSAGASQKFDLVSSHERILRGKLPGLELVFERFSRNVRTALTRSLGRNCLVTVDGVETVKFGQFLKRLPHPSSLHLFRMSPLSGQALAVFSHSLASTLIDVSFGGKGGGKPKAAGREYSPIETRLLGKSAITLIDELPSAFQSIISLQCVYVAPESNPLAVSIVPSSDNVVVVSIDVTIENGNGQLLFCFPWTMLQPVREKLASGMHSSSIERNLHASSAIERHVRAANCEVAVTLGEGKILVKDLLELRVGDIIPLETPSTALATVAVEGKAKYNATVGVSKGNKAAKVEGRLR